MDDRAAQEPVKSLHIPMSLHKQLKRAACERDCSIRSLVVGAIQASLGLSPTVPPGANVDGLYEVVPSRK